MSVKIVPFERKYLDVVTQLYIDVFREPPYNGTRTFEKQRELIKECLDSTSFIGFVAFKGRELIGFCFGTSTWSHFMFNKKHRVPILSSVRKDGFNVRTRFEFGEIGVKKSFRNQGLGKVLSKKFVTAVKKKGIYETILVNTRNPALVKALKSLDLDLIKKIEKKDDPWAKYYFNV